MPIFGKSSARLLVTGALAAVLPFTLASPVVHAHTAPGDDVGAAEVVNPPQDIVDDEGTDEDVEVMSMQASPEVWASLPRGGRGIMDERALINAVEDYWTPERIARAQPVTVPASVAAESKAQGSERDVLQRDAQTVSAQGVSSQKTISHPVDPSVDVFTIGGEPKKNWATGKLFMTDINGKDYFCTASVVNSSSKHVISTASHCLFDLDTKAEYKNVVFMGGFKLRERRNLTFVINKMAISPTLKKEGLSARGMWFDIAFASTHPNRKGLSPVDVLGAHGFIVGAKPGVRKVVIPAYPLNLRGGEVQQFCRRTTDVVKWRHEPNNRIYRFNRVFDCHFQVGASGSPWLVDYSDETGHGYAIGVSSVWDYTYSGRHFNAGPSFKKNSSLHYYNKVNK